MSKQGNSVEKMIEGNNQLREKLTDNNKEYYEKLLLYIRSAGLFYDDYEIESLLLQILQDIISAQNNGQSAEEFFGKNPQVAADELIHNLGKASKKEIFKLIGVVFIISSFFSLLSALTTRDKGINILVLILNGILSFLVVGIVFFILHKGIYKKITIKKFTDFLFIWIFFVLIIGLFVLIQLFTPSILTVYLSNLSGICIISILLIGVTVFTFTRNNQIRQIWWPFLPFVWILGVIGIASRLPLMENYISSNNGKIMIVLLTVFGLILFYGLTYLNFKKGK
ncbi:DUF1129 family protein [Clostridium kluyveri]|uniref:DUF1129 domain-containing protein n=2 Tax=Clostridium kluyveri TaxID=1534 RepID=A5N8T6_CLOK5|nr:DUF1129 family protein [Clostridium kluyveri]EDK33717.1 Conserved hypothetical protein [Clostridium kluyveri DSM 555]BAH06608.1 hypothetical protein CKR_1557 [Clostridium kluyveri NBRC 12016]